MNALAKIPAPAWYVLGGLVVFFVLLETAKKGVAAAAHEIDPTNHDNVFSAGVNGIGSAISGDNDFSLGAKIYDWTHPDNPFTR